MSVRASDGVFLELERDYQALQARRKNLKKMSSEALSDFSEEVLDFAKKFDRSLGAQDIAHNPLSDDFMKLAMKIDKLSSAVVRERKNRSGFLRAYYAVAGTPAPQLYAKCLRLSGKERFDAEVEQEKQKIDAAWSSKVTKAFEADPDASLGTKAGIEGRRWGTTYLLTAEQAEALRRRKTAYDQVQATLNVCERRGLTGEAAYETTKYMVKTAASTVQELAEQSVLTTGQAVMVGLGGPVYAVLILAWSAAFGVLEKGGNVLSRGFATLDAFLEQGIMRNVGKVPRKSDGSVDWSEGNALKNIGLGFLHSLRAPFFLSKILCSGVSAVTKAVEQGIGNFAKKNIIPLLGMGGTAIGAYFIAITLASVFTLGIPLAITAVGLTFALAGAALATYMRTKAKAQELVSLKLSPEEETMLMRHDYQQKQKQTLEMGPKDRQVVGAELQHRAVEAQALVEASRHSRVEQHPSLTPERASRPAITPVKNKSKSKLPGQGMPAGHQSKRKKRKGPTGSPHE